MREKHGEVGNDNSIISLTEIKLPFVCDDLFDSKVVPYRGTGIEFTRFCWSDGMTGRVEVILKMEIVLVKKERNLAAAANSSTVQEVTLNEMSLDDLYD